MLRWLGAGLILCGGLLTRRALLEGERRTRRTRRALADAFETMEAEIRLLLTPVPALLRRAYGDSADAFFTQVSQGLSRGMPLAEAWRRAAETLALPEDERESVAALGARLGGAEESARTALTFAASTLRRSDTHDETRRRERERLTTTLCICLSLLLAVLLL